MKCENCNNEIDYSKLSEYANGNFCSKKCARSYSTKNDDKTETKIANCINCGKEIEVNKRTSKRYYKCNDCIIKRKCYECGRILGKTTKGKYCKLHFQKQQSYKDSVSMGTKGKCGGLRRGAGYGKSGWYKGYYCDSSWELAWVIYNLDNNVKFVRNKKSYTYYFNGKQRRYYPDFILETGTIIEIKGYETKQTDIKHSLIPNLKIIRKKDIKFYINYVKKRYNVKNVIELYENKRV